MAEPVNINDIQETLQQAQAKHLRTLENWGGQTRKVCGVPVVQMLNYELIQHVNQAYLKRLLTPESEPADG